LESNAVHRHNHTVLKIPFLSKKDFFSEKEKKLIVDAIGEAETQTSGEIRVFVESHCRYVDPLDRAAEVFTFLKMEKTAARNAVLLYLAFKDRQLAIFGDQGIHEKVGEVFWRNQVSEILSRFQQAHFAEAIAIAIKSIGEALKFHFPYDRQTDINELPDDIVFGR
jgi:uncharacterized membrane protein